MQLAHVIELHPNAEQAALFQRAAGVARCAYNWGLARWMDLYRAGLKPHWMSLQKEFVSRIDAEFPFCRAVPSTAYMQPFRHLGKAFDTFFRRSGRHPTFKARRRTVPSFKLSGAIRQLAPGILQLPVIGAVQATEDIRFPGRIVSATVTRDVDRWTIAVLCDCPEHQRANTGSAVVGIDLGLASFATMSSGERVQAPRPLRQHLRRLRRRSRSLSRKQQGSHRRERATRRLARLHRRIRNVRKDFLHQLTTRIVRENQTIVLEDLAVGNLVRNRSLSQAIADASWGEFRRQITYKAVLHGRTVLVADRWFASSQICSACGRRHQGLALAERTYACSGCGLVLDRDVNAAINLRTLAQGGTDARGEVVPLVVKGLLPDHQARSRNRESTRAQARKTTSTPVEMCRL
jgi:putative transposase